jgi:hypothetical protein
MLSLDFWPRLGEPLDLDRVMRDAREMANQGGARSGVNALLNAIGVRCPPGDENYYVNALNYYLGIVHAHARQPELAIEHLHRSGVLPSFGGDQTFDDQIATSLTLGAEMERARERGLPTFLIAAMPRSASATLVQSLAALLSMPILRASVGALPDYYLVPNWLNRVSPGGAVLHDHFGAGWFNRQVMKEGGVRAVFVLVRDPRAAALSFAEFRYRDWGELPEHVVLEVLKNQYIPWLSDWLALSKAEGVRIDWISSSAVRTDLAGTWREIGRMMVNDYPALEPYLDELPEIRRANYRHGGDQRWRQQLSKPVQEQMWAAIPRDMAEKFELLP